MNIVEKIKKTYRERRENYRHKRLSPKAELLRSASLNCGKKIIILSSDCTGGRLMKDYSLASYTPTVNNWYSASDFIKICEQPDHYLSLDVERAGLDEHGEPIGKIGDVTIHFGHSDSYEESVKKWKVGCKNYFRAKKNNNYEICIIQNDRNGFSQELIDRFNKLPYKHKVLFSHKIENVSDNIIYMKGEDKKPYVDVMTNFENILTTKRRYDRFDFFNWFLDMYNN